jgi:oxygen-independent coproporphyrinogen III oxidase
MTLPLPSPALIEKYGRAGPRYTSYPAATEWSSTFGPAELDQALARADATDAPVSVYVHVPFCEEMCRFCGCNVIATKDRARADAYLDTLEREIALWAARLPHRRRLGQLHLGGGTPTFLTLPQLERLHAMVTRRFRPEPDAELALEADPAVTTPAQVALLGRLGFTRLSVGVQDFDPTVQAAINRIQTFEQTSAVVAAARAAGFRSVNVDLIYGLPHQTPASFEATIRKVLELAPDRLALFGYAHVPWMKPNQRLLPEAHLPNARQRVELFVAAANLLEANGFRQIGLDHFARETDALARAQDDGSLTRNFQGYAVNPAPDTLAFGVSAISDVGGAFAQSAHKLSEWTALVEAGRLPITRGLVRKPDDELRGAAIRRLMCLGRLDVGALAREHGEQAWELFRGTRPELLPLADDGLVRLSDDAAEITSLGRLFLRNVAMPFDAYLPREAPVRRFSQTV